MLSEEMPALSGGAGVMSYEQYASSSGTRQTSLSIINDDSCVT